METVNLSFDIETSDAGCPISVEILLNGIVLLQNQHVQQKIEFSHDFNDDDGDHELQIVITGKTTDHTVIDEHGNITKDAVLQISNAVLDEVVLHHLFFDHCVYTHDFNSTQPEIKDIFLGLAGCNGTISFKFSTPIYLWLLENM